MPDAGSADAPCVVGPPGRSPTRSSEYRSTGRDRPSPSSPRDRRYPARQHGRSRCLAVQHSESMTEGRLIFCRDALRAIMHPPYGDPDCSSGSSVVRNPRRPRHPASLQEGLYPVIKTAIVSLACALTFSTASYADHSGSAEDQLACTPDVYRLCSQYIPDEDTIVSCLQRNKPQLSAGVPSRILETSNRKTQSRLRRLTVGKA